MAVYCGGVVRRRGDCSGGSGDCLEWSDACSGCHLEGEFLKEIVDLVNGN